MAKLWKAGQPLVLASTSTTRLNLLLAAGLPVIAIGAHVDERAIEAALQAQRVSPDLIALELAKAKGMAVSSRMGERWVVAADQTLALGDTQFHKPSSVEEGRIQLQTLRGKTHLLHSAVVAYYDGKLRYQHVQSAAMHMRRFSDEFLSAYLLGAGEIVTRSVGGYQLEGLGVHLFEHVEGDHSTILGLPLVPLLSFFRKSGLVEE